MLVRYAGCAAMAGGVFISAAYCLPQHVGCRALLAGCWSATRRLAPVNYCSGLKAGLVYYRGSKHLCWAARRGTDGGRHRLRV